MAPDLVRIRKGRNIQYALRDSGRGFGDVTVFRVDVQGKIGQIGILSPVRPDGYVMTESSGQTLFSEGIPWWLLDMRPQGFMGRAYAERHAVNLGLPGSIGEWTDAHALRALIAHGHDASGNLLLGQLARQRFLDAPVPTPVTMDAKPAQYAALASAAVGTSDSWSSAGGEQPKFTAYAETQSGARHVIVKFSTSHENPVAQRWRDLLLAEHHALCTLNDSGIEASISTVIDFEGQRFLEVERFDRVGPTGRRGLLSLAAVDAEFTAMARAVWPEVTEALARGGQITANAHERAALLFAFGALIANTDMHHGNLSFVTTHGRPYELAPAYDMLPMSFQPRTSGIIGNTVAPVSFHHSVPDETWPQALNMATLFVRRLQSDPRLSRNFAPCMDALRAHLDTATQKITQRLGSQDVQSLPYANIGVSTRMRY